MGLASADILAFVEKLTKRLQLLAKLHIIRTDELQTIPYASSLNVKRLGTWSTKPKLKSFPYR